jgi:hypothetical protein
MSQVLASKPNLLVQEGDARATVFDMLQPEVGAIS